jgi:hypothetical protein
LVFEQKRRLETMRQRYMLHILPPSLAAFKVEIDRVRNSQREQGIRTQT